MGNRAGGNLIMSITIEPMVNSQSKVLAPIALTKHGSTALMLLRLVGLKTRQRQTLSSSSHANRLVSRYWRFTYFNGI
jgi:hypothetical protein